MKEGGLSGVMILDWAGPQRFSFTQVLALLLETPRQLRASHGEKELDTCVCLRGFL